MSKVYRKDRLGIDCMGVTKSELQVFNFLVFRSVRLSMRRLCWLTCGRWLCTWVTRWWLTSSPRWWPRSMWTGSRSSCVCCMTSSSRRDLSVCSASSPPPGHTDFLIFRCDSISRLDHICLSCHVTLSKFVKEDLKALLINVLLTCLNFMQKDFWQFQSHLLIILILFN